MGDLKSVTVRQALGLILRPLGLDFTADGGVIRVFRREPETRLFAVDYLAADRTGEASVGIDPAARVNGSYARVNTSVKTDVFGGHREGHSGPALDPRHVQRGRRAGLVQVTDFPERLDRIGNYLEAVSDRVQRQVQIEARVVEVEMTGDKPAMLDWTGLRQTRDSEKVMAALAAQGKVTVVASPRLVVLNNEPAIVRAEGITIAVTPQVARRRRDHAEPEPDRRRAAGRAVGHGCRVLDGETIVIAGTGLERETRERKNAGNQADGSGDPRSSPGSTSSSSSS
jgi:type II secretory pathway component HofQ